MDGEHFFPGSLPEALTIRGHDRVRPVAGGTDLMVQHRPHAPIPVRLDAPPLFLAHIAELTVVSRERSVLRIGAAATLRQLQELPACPPGLREVLRWFASPAVRNAATIGGNLCNASPAGDLLPWLIARDATVELQETGGRRELPVADFITGPGQTVLRQTELLTAVCVRTDDAPEEFRFYRKVAPRRSNALSKLAVYAQAQRAPDGALAAVQIAVGAVAPTVVRCRDAEALLCGRNAVRLAAAVPDALALYDRQIVPIDDQRSTSVYRKRTALTLIRYILEDRLPDYLERT